MTDQHTALQNTLADWMGEYDQTDDILVIGFALEPNNYPKI